VPVGNNQFELTVRGLNFKRESVVLWQDIPRFTVFIDSTQLRATIPAADVANAGFANVTVSDLGRQATSNGARFLVIGRNTNTSAASYASTELAAEQIVAVFGSNLAITTCQCHDCAVAHDARRHNCADQR
jgi:hypothetical protein